MQQQRQLQDWVWQLRLRGQFLWKQLLPLYPFAFVVVLTLQSFKQLPCQSSNLSTSPVV
jgi:hypothetical protein